MPCFSPEAQRLFSDFGEENLLSELEAFDQRLHSKRKEVIEYGDPKELSPQKRASRNLELLLQVQLHRAQCFLSGANVLLLDQNIYGIALVIRGPYESAAVLGYFCDRFESLKSGHIEFEEFEWNVADAVMGARHEQFSEARPPLPILTCIEKADRFLDKHIFNEKQGVLRDCYDWLSEFAHPNFLSNVSAFRLDKERCVFVLRHDGKLLKEDFDLLGYLGIAAGPFICLSEALEERTANGFS